MMFKLAPWRACWLGALLVPPVVSCAQTEVQATLPTVTVQAELDPQASATAKVTHINAQQISDQQARHIKDVVRYEPGVSVTNKPSRFGLAGFNIRGVDENRILMQVDGVRMPDTYAIGGYSNASRNMVDIELLDVIDIQRGTGSAANGSDALGGTVSYVTPSPEGVLQGKQSAATLKSLHQTADKSTSLVVTGAVGNDLLKVLMRGVKRVGQETETKGDVGGAGLLRTIANPQDQDSDAALLKVAITPTSNYRAELGYQRSERDVQTNALSMVPGGLSADMNHRDHYRHEQWTIDQRFSNLPVGKLDIKLFMQDGHTTQYTREDRTTTSPFGETLRERMFDFQQESLGLKLDITTRIQGNSPHLLEWGVAWSKTDTAQMRDGYTTLLNGTVNQSVSIETFPARDTPLSRTRRSALYVQDQWFVSDELTLIAGGRYEDYRLTTQPDSIYLANPAAVSTTGAHFKNFSPKLGAVWSWGHGYSVGGQYSHGFRAPPYDDVNNGFLNSSVGYTTVANPGLQEETSRGIDLVLRHADDAGSWSLTLFDTHYRNFIEGEQLACPGDPACVGDLMTFQSRNVPKVRMYGLEGRLVRQLLSGWTVHGAVAYARGRKTLTNEPLDSVNPASGTVGLVRQKGRFRYEISSSFALAKHATDAAHAEDSMGLKKQFLTPGYAVVDLRLNWQFAKNSQLTFGAYNIFDKLYYHWTDVPVSDIHILDSQAGPQRYSQPGRNFAASLLYAF